MTKLLLFGASRGVGFELAQQAKAAEYEISSVTRIHNEALNKLGVKQVTGDACNKAHLLEVVKSLPKADAVVCTIGGGPLGASADGLGASNVIDIAKELGITRLILVSSLGAGESRSYASERLLSAIGPILEEKTLAENHLKASGLDFTIIRPGGLLNEPATGRGTLKEDPSVHGRIPRADVAKLILDCLGDASTIGKVYSAVAV